MSEPFLSITDRGGRIGRLQWFNTIRHRSYLAWGELSWDTWWPAPEPIFTPEWVKAMSARVREVEERFGRLSMSLNLAERAVGELAETWASEGP